MKPRRSRLLDGSLLALIVVFGAAVTFLLATADFTENTVSRASLLSTGIAALAAIAGVSIVLIATSRASRRLKEEGQQLSDRLGEVESSQEELERRTREEALSRVEDQVRQDAAAYRVERELGKHFDEQERKHSSKARRWIWSAGFALGLVIGVAAWLVLADERPASDNTADVVTYIVRTAALLVVPIYIARVSVAQYRRADELATLDRTKAVLIRSASSIAEGAPEEVRSDVYRMMAGTVFSLPGVSQGLGNEPITLVEYLGGAARDGASRATGK